MRYTSFMMLRYVVVLLQLSSLLLYSTTNSTVFVESSTTSTDSAVVVSCIVSYSLDAKPITLTKEQMNDGYCDCIYTGEDEIETNACSGYSSWPGLNHIAIRPQYQKQKASQLYFTCPKQPDLRLSSSKLHDGVCDCCDGYDEGMNSHCTDQCHDILLAQETAKRIMKETYTIGSVKRQELLQEYQTLMQQVHSDMQIQQQQLPNIQAVIQSHQTVLQQLKVRYITSRINFMKDKTRYNAIRHGLYRMVSSLSIHELQTLLIHICQLSGEISDMYDDQSNIKSCIPLRLAGLDYGIQWESNTYQFKQLVVDDINNTSNDNVEQLVSLSDLLLYNQQPTDRAIHTKVWSTKMYHNNQPDRHKHRKRPHRRLSEEDDDEDHFDDEEDYDSYDDPSMDHDDNDPDEDEEYPNHHQHHYTPPVPYEDIDETTNKDDLLVTIKNMKLSMNRNHRFMEQSQRISEQLDQIKEQQDQQQQDQQQDQQEGEEDTKENEPEKKDEGIDPMAITMIRKALDVRSKRIERGYNFAISALVLIDAIIDTMKPSNTTSDAVVSTTRSEDDVKSILQDLIMNTIHHSEISSQHIYEILINVLPEFVSADKSEEVDPKTCPSPWIQFCPPRSVQRQDSMIPPDYILQQMKQFCHAKQQEPIPTGIGFCQVDNDPSVTATAPTTPHDLPTDMADGFYGYYFIQRRTADDPLNHIFDATFHNEDNTYITQMNELQEKIDALQNEENAINNKIRELHDSIGSKYGTDGELHSIRDMCFDIEAGKYIYEVCMFQAAKQRDVGSSKNAGGTDLGRWTGYDHDHDDNRRIWKWENGQKCWNGPSRSAYVYVTCGVEHKIISADEPETCKYVFEMESPIACDDAHRMKHGW